MDLDSARLLLDETAMQPLWGQLPALQGRTLRRAEFDTLWVKPGRHFNVCYRLMFTGTGPPPMLASACALTPARAAQIGAGTARHGAEDPSACPRCSTWLARDTVLLQLFPFDYRLPTLSACCNAGRVARMLGAEGRFTACEPSGYRPGMRCQLRYRSAAGESAYGKVAVEKVPGQTFRLHEQVYAQLASAQRGVQVPPPLHYLPELHLMLVAGAAGESLHAGLRRGRDLSAAVGAAARALAHFHQLTVAGVERVYGVQDEVDLVRSWVDLVAAVYPDLGEDLWACAAELASRPPEPVRSHAFVHRDFYDKQVLVADGALTFLDMDTACLGEAEIDLGNFAAHLRLRGLQWNLQPLAGALEQAFVSAYPLPVDSVRVDWYRRATLLRLACGYALRPRWRHLTPRLVAEARP